MRQRLKSRIGTIIIALIICLMVIYIHLLSHQNTQKIYVEQTEKTIIKMKKEFLKDTVDNIITEINRIRESKKSSYIRNTEARRRRFEDEFDLEDKEFIQFFISRFEDDVNPKMWSALLWREDGEILYRSANLSEDSLEETIKELKETLVSYSAIEKGYIKGAFGISKKYIDGVVKKEVGELIRERRFINGSYIWVNEIIDYKGGENYAIRLIHPGLIETEGMYLSTDAEDIKGNKPYLTELEGVIRFGELFHTYYFNKLNSDIISEKISFAKLYRDYDWVISMGVHLDEIDTYIESTTKNILSRSSVTIIRLLRYIFGVLLLGFLVLYILENRNLNKSTKVLESEINYDALTGAVSRRGGEKSLNNFFEEYKIKGNSPAIMMLDINKFKLINDSYGHDLGDIVLMEVVKSIYNDIRSSDFLIRWGGDEFIAILPGLREEHIYEFSDKLFRGISSLEILTEDEFVHVTVSLGFSYFKEADKDYKEALKRADFAMYKSKGEGENIVNIIL